MVSKQELIQIIENKKLLDEYLIKCFKSIDTDNSGYVDIKELQNMLFNVSDNSHVNKPNQKKINEIFDKIDENKDGMISKDELIHCMDLLYPHEEAIKKANEIFEEIDFNNDGSINFSEFITVNLKKEKLLNEDMLQKAFKMFDLDGNGFITIDELKETIPLEIQNNSQWIEIVKEVDQDGDCQINYEEFKNMMEKISSL